MGVFNACTFVGEFANDAAALTEIQTRKWDSANNGTGTPVSGMVYYDTTLTCFKIYANGSWRLIATGSGSVGSSFMDFWSEPDNEVVLSSAVSPNPITLPNIVVPATTLGSSFIRVVGMLKFRKLYNPSVSAVRLSSPDGGVTNIVNVQMKKSADAWPVFPSTSKSVIQLVASLAEGAFYQLGGPGDNPGDAIIGDDDAKGWITHADIAAGITINARFDSILTNLGSSMTMYDVQTGVRIYYQ